MELIRRADWGRIIFSLRWPRAQELESVRGEYSEVLESLKEQDSLSEGCEFKSEAVSHIDVVIRCRWEYGSIIDTVRVPSEAEEDRRHLHRELKTSKQDRTRVSNRIKVLLANNGLTLRSWKDVAGQLERLRLWNGNPLPSSLRGRLDRYAADYAYYTERIRELEGERRHLLSQELRHGGSQGSAVRKAAQQSKSQPRGLTARPTLRAAEIRAESVSSDFTEPEFRPNRTYS